MLFSQLRPKIKKYPLFISADILKWFPQENANQVRVQLSQWVHKGWLQRVKKDLYLFNENDVPESSFLAGAILSPSYVSLETALHYYSIIPDVAFTTLSVTPLITRKFQTKYGQFSYRHIKPEYFFGWKTSYDKDRLYAAQIALPEKALLDYLYFHLPQLHNNKSLKDWEEERFYFDNDFNWGKYKKMLRAFNYEPLTKCAYNLFSHYAS